MLVGSLVLKALSPSFKYFSRVWLWINSSHLKQKWDLVLILVFYKKNKKEKNS
jgi:hypothetical protein